MENHKDLILQAFAFGVKVIIPTVKQGLYMEFSERWQISEYHERLRNLNIIFTGSPIGHTGLIIEIKAI